MHREDPSDDAIARHVEGLMADLDSAEKRKAASGIHLYASGPGVTNNATHDQEWRQEAGYGYAGILAEPPGGAVPHHRLGFGAGYARQG